MMDIQLDTKEAQEEFLKTRIETLGLPLRLVKTLSDNNIRTVGGIAHREDRELKKAFGISDMQLKDLKEKLSVLARSAGEKVKEHFRAPSSELEEEASAPERLLSHELNEEDDIVAMFAEYFGVDQELIETHTRKQEVVKVRSLIMYLLREYGGMSYPAIGRLIGGRDHTTVIHSYNKIKKQINNDPKIEAELAQLIEKVKLVKERRLRVEEIVIPDIISTMQRERFVREPVAKEIPERNMKILELYREGLTLANIGKVFGVSRERVRQVAFKTIAQLALNEAITKGISMDTDVLMEEEKKKREAAQGRKNPSEQEKEKRWSRYYLACKSCGTTSIPHVRNGLCEQCVGQYRSERREEIIAKHGAACDKCGILRADALRKYGRDVYITKDKKVLCRGCFLKFSGKKLGSYKNFEWSRSYPACVSCGTTEVPHAGKGLCLNCSKKHTDESREKMIAEHGSVCDKCGIGRAEAQQKYHRDFFLTKTGKAYCRKCFQKYGLAEMRLAK